MLRVETCSGKDREARLGFYQLRNAVQQIPTLQGDSQHTPTATNSYRNTPAGIPAKFHESAAQYLKLKGLASLAGRGSLRSQFSSFIERYWASFSFFAFQFVHCIELYWAVFSWIELYWATYTEFENHWICLGLGQCELYDESPKFCIIELQWASFSFTEFH